MGAHNSVVGADQGFRAPSWDQESVRDSVHEDSASAPSRQVNDHGRVSGTPQELETSFSQLNASYGAIFSAQQEPEDSFKRLTGKLIF